MAVVGAKALALTDGAEEVGILAIGQLALIGAHACIDDSGHIGKAGADLMDGREGKAVSAHRAWLTNLLDEPQASGLASAEDKFLGVHTRASRVILPALARHVVGDVWQRQAGLERLKGGSLKRHGGTPFP